MAIPSIYINLEDDVSRITARLKHNPAKQVILVCPKRCFLFNDSINLRLLKKQTDLLGKEIFILTMDEKGQLFAKEAGFQLKFLPKAGGGSAGVSDMRMNKKPQAQIAEPKRKAHSTNPIAATVKEIRHIAQKIVPEKVRSAVADHSPLHIHAVKDAELPVSYTDTIFPDEAMAAPVVQKPHSRTSKIVTGIVAVSLILVLLVVFVILPKASVVVYARSEPVTRDMEISLSANVKNLDSSKLAMPATAVEDTQSASAKFESSGKKQVGNKAAGTVKIYNFTKQPLNLKANTTTLSAGGKTYTLLNDISLLKPTTYKNAKTKEVDPASLGDSMEIVASDGGEDFNLPAGTRLEISNQVFGSKPQLLYAKTDTEITGGTTRYLSFISQADLDAAKTQLISTAYAQEQTKLTASNLVLADKAYTFDVSQFSSDSPLGTETPNFQGSLTGNITGLAYVQSDLDSLILQRINQTLDPSKTLHPKKDNATSVKVKSLDMANQLAVLSVHFEGQAVYNLDLGNIAPQLTGKTQPQVYEILKSKAEIDRVDITLAPAWQKNFPLFASKINVTYGNPDDTSSSN